MIGTGGYKIGGPHFAGYAGLPVIGEHTRYMRDWTKCFGTKYVGIRMSDFVRHFKKYHPWFEYRSLIAPGRRIRWK